MYANSLEKNLGFEGDFFLLGEVLPGAEQAIFFWFQNEEGELEVGIKWVHF